MAASADTVDDNDETQAGQPGSSPSGGSNKRSKIRFPYYDLDTAEQIARTVHDKRGGTCETVQLAADLGHEPTSGSLRLRLSAATLYGVIKQSKGVVTLTQLGRRMTDTRTAPEARLEAYFNVPLYTQIYEEYKSGKLPADSGLEERIRDLGVTKNQVPRARQVFARAAEQAGFFREGRDRLVKPSFIEPAVEPEPEPAPAPSVAEGDKETTDALANPLLAELFRAMLPPEGTAFPAKDRRRLFRALAVNIDVVYGEPDDGRLDPDSLAGLFRLNGQGPVVARGGTEPQRS